MPKICDSTDQTDKANALLQAAKNAGSEAADVCVLKENATSVCVRSGAIETTEKAESEEIFLRVFIGKKSASVSATMNAEVDFDLLAQRAVVMAKASPEDPFQGLAESFLLAREFPDLDLFDSTSVSISDLKERALTVESSALGVPGISNSCGGQASMTHACVFLMTSEGFLGHYKTSSFLHAVSVIAGEGTSMERDYDFSASRYLCDLESPEVTGRKAAERTVKRLHPRKIETGRVNVLFEERAARSLAGHLAASVNGASIARKTSFLEKNMDKKIMSEAIIVTDDPFRVRGQGSRPFDGEGVRGEKLAIVDKGVLKSWLLSSSAARELGTKTNGRGVRSGSCVVPASTNFAIEPGQKSVEQLMKEIKNGLYVTELIGQGVDIVTGHYSRAVAGYKIENGEIAFPVAGVGIASNLAEMFLHMTAADHLDRNFSVAAPAILVEGMILGGT